MNVLSFFGDKITKDEKDAQGVSYRGVEEEKIEKKSYQLKL